MLTNELKLNTANCGNIVTLVHYLLQIIVMITATQRRPHTSAPLDGSRTITLRDAQSHPEVDNAAGGGAGPSSGEPNTTVGVLKLRGAQRRTRQRVAWGADVVDNEGCGKKKSKSARFVYACSHVHVY